MEQRVKELNRKYKEIFSDGNKVRNFQAPGRVNLIGEHTDYNGGFVMPMAINRNVLSAAAPRGDNEVHIHSLNFDKTIQFKLNNIEHRKEDGWGNYVKGMAKVLMDKGYKICGMNILFEGDIPLASGLSSSAAIEVLSGKTFAMISGVEIPAEELALLAQKAENEFIGVNCGIMDQYIISTGKKNNALFLDCRNLSSEHVPFIFDDVYVVIGNTKKERGLVDSEYNSRRKECEHGVKEFNKILGSVKDLRDVTSRQFEESKDKLPEITRKRCQHVIYEDERVKKAVKYLKSKDLESFGNLMVESHESLRDLYEVSCRELDILVEEALKMDGVFGSRMTGAGFGGCNVSLVLKDHVEKFIVLITEAYKKKTSRKPEFYICTPEDGAKEIVL